MRKKDVVIGAFYKAKIGQNLTVVQVQQPPDPGRKYFVCRNVATDRTVRCTAAKFRGEIPSDKIPDLVQRIKARMAHLRELQKAYKP